MRRRDFITLLGVAAAAWPFAARAQQRERLRRIGVLLGLAPGDPWDQARFASFAQGLQELGWMIGRNIQIDTRSSAGNADDARRYATELIALAPEVILASGNSGVAPLLQATRAVPIVFVIVPDPVGAGFVDGLARPGGNATGFLAYEYSLGAKWLELLKELSPRLTRAAVLRDPALASGPGQFAAIQSVASQLGFELTPVNVRDAGEIERSIAAFARSADGGLIVTGNPLIALHRDLIIGLAARHKLPAIYIQRSFASAGGLISYGPDFLDQYRRAAGYVDRILRARSPPTFRCKRRPSTSLLSISRPPRRSVWRSRRRCSYAPTR